MSEEPRRFEAELPLESMLQEDRRKPEGFVAYSQPAREPGRLQPEACSLRPEST